MLKGWARVWFDGIREVRLEEGSCMYQEPGIHHRVLEYSDDYRVIEIISPADFETVSVAPQEQRRLRGARIPCYTGAGDMRPAIRDRGRFPFGCVIAASHRTGRGAFAHLMKH